MKQPVERRLTAVLATDVAGYSRLMGADEEGTHELLKAHFRQLVDPRIKVHRGRIVKNTGDGMLVEFPSAVGAVRCAAEIPRDDRPQCRYPGRQAYSLPNWGQPWRRNRRRPGHLR